MENLDKVQVPKKTESQVFDEWKDRLEEMVAIIKLAATIEEFQKIEEEIALYIQQSQQFDLFSKMAELVITRIQIQLNNQKSAVSNIHFLQCKEQIESFSKKLEQKNLEDLGKFKLTKINKFFMLQKHVEEIYRLWNTLIVAPFKAMHPEYEPSALRARAIATTDSNEIKKMQSEITLLIKTRVLPREYEWGIRGELNFNFRNQDVEALQEAQKNGLEQNIRSKEEKKKELEKKIAEAQSAEPRDPALEEKLRLELSACEKMLRRLKEFKNGDTVQI